VLRPEYFHLVAFLAAQALSAATTTTFRYRYRCPYAFRFKATHPSRTSDNNSAYEVTCLAWRRVHAVNLFWRHAWIARNKLRFVRLLAALHRWLV